MTAFRTVLPLLLLVTGTGCFSAEQVLPGDWNASDGGTITLDDDGTGWTDGAYFIDSVCQGGNGAVTEFGIDWFVQDDPDVVADNFAWRPDADAEAMFEAEFGCTMGEGMIEEPILSVNQNQVEFGYDALVLSSVFQTLTRQ